MQLKFSHAQKQRTSEKKDKIETPCASWFENKYLRHEMKLINKLKLPHLSVVSYSMLLIILIELLLLDKYLLLKHVLITDCDTASRFKKKDTVQFYSNEVFIFN